jgi:outer membrane protein assembly factor BamB
MRTLRARALLLTAVVLAASGCATATGGERPAAPARTQSPAPPAPGGTNWLIYHANALHTGLVNGLPKASALSSTWTRSLDGAVYGQPLVIGSLVVAATENDSLYGLNRATGAVEWRTHVGTPVPLSALPCGDINPLGITGTPVYDPATKLVYAVAEETGYKHVLYGFTLTGKVKLNRVLPTPDGHPRYDQQRPGLAIDQGRVYVAFGGLDGDCGPYVGSVVGAPVSGDGPLISYQVPTTREGAIWGTAGPVLSGNGMLYVTVGNGAASSPPYDGSDSVLELTPGLHRVSFFAPSTWANDNENDLDLGSMSPALLSNGYTVADGKRGIAYLLKTAHLGGIGGQIAKTSVCAAFGGPAVDGTVAYIPCEGGGMAAIDTAGGNLKVLWRGPGSASGSPVLGGGAVWVADWDSGTLYELSQATGQVQQQISLGSDLPHFASPSLSGGLALIGTLNGVAAVRGV